jgi:3-dehydroquinate dehydratase II
LKILIINGANLNLLGSREKEHYGSKSLDEIIKMTEEKVNQFDNSISIDWEQSNIEGEIVNFIQNAQGRYDSIIINPGGYSHTSVSILDALKVFKGLKVEVHLSKISSRGDTFRQNMITAQAADILLEGLLDLSYFIGVFTVNSRLNLKG